MKSIHISFFIVTLMIFLNINYVKADEVYLENGDRISGEIQSLEQDNLIINTDFAGELSIRREKINYLKTTEPVTVIFNDNKYITGQIAASENLQLQVISNQTEISEEFDLAEIKSVFRGDPMKVALEKQKVKFNGDIDIGLSSSSGNTDDDTYLATGELRARLPKDRYTLRAERAFERSDGDKTKDETFGSIQYDHFFNEKWYLFNAASFEEDEIEFLNLRTSLSAGTGYQFYETSDLFLSVELGIGYVNEDFENDSDDDYLSSRWSIDYEHNIFSWVGLFHHQEGLFGLETSDDVVIRTRSGFKFPFGNGFNAKAQANFDWDKSPAEEADRTDKEYIFTLGYGF